MSAAPLVLLADDFPDAVELYQTYLEFHGFRVVTAADGRAAVEAASAHRPDIILLDLRMPVMSGTEVMQTLRADPVFASVPIIALTAHALKDERAAAMTAGFDAYLAKPIAPPDLLAKLKALLPRSPD